MSYTNTFITVAPDCPETSGQPPPDKAVKKTKALIEYQLLLEAPYTLDQDDLNYAVYQLQKGDLAEPRAAYLSKGRPCMRASALTKRYGWGAHYDDAGRIAIYPLGSGDYDRQSAAAERVLAGMRSKRG